VQRCQTTANSSANKEHFLSELAPGLNWLAVSAIDLFSNICTLLDNVASMGHGLTRQPCYI
jgi:hypothetical protein